jgi:hypothetical protein
MIEDIDNDKAPITELETMYDMLPDPLNDR